MTPGSRQGRKREKKIAAGVTWGSTLLGNSRSHHYPLEAKGARVMCQLWPASGRGLVLPPGGQTEPQVNLHSAGSRDPARHTWASGKGNGYSGSNVFTVANLSKPSSSLFTLALGVSHTLKTGVWTAQPPIRSLASPREKPSHRFLVISHSQPGTSAVNCEATLLSSGPRNKYRRPTCFRQALFLAWSPYQGQPKQKAWNVP